MSRDPAIRVQATLCILANLILPFMIAISIWMVPTLYGVSTLIPCLALGWVYPIMIWLLNRQKHSFIDECTREALNFTLTIYICLVVLGNISIAGCLIIFSGTNSFFTVVIFFSSLIGMLITSILFLFYCFAIVLVSIQAARGNIYKYPLTIRFFR